jgi:hypothetical protein
MKKDAQLPVTGAASGIFLGANGPVLSSPQWSPANPVRGAADDARYLRRGLLSPMQAKPITLTSWVAWRPVMGSHPSAGKSKLQAEDNVR